MQENCTDTADAGHNMTEAADIRSLASFKLSILVDAAERMGQYHTIDRADLRLNDWRVLALAYALKPARFSDIASILSMDKGQLSRIVKLLCERGLISTKTDRLDQRAICLALTDRGHEVHDRLLADFRGINERILSVLDGEERRELDRMLSLLAQSIERVSAGRA